jgi:hypothetical protein
MSTMTLNPKEGLAGLGTDAGQIIRAKSPLRISLTFPPTMKSGVGPFSPAPSIVTLM